MKGKKKTLALCFGLLSLAGLAIAVKKAKAD